jgi:hypothetical protein
MRQKCHDGILSSHHALSWYQSLLVGCEHVSITRPWCMALQVVAVMNMWLIEDGRVRVALC